MDEEQAHDVGDLEGVGDPVSEARDVRVGGPTEEETETDAVTERDRGAVGLTDGLPDTVVDLTDVADTVDVVDRDADTLDEGVTDVDRTGVAVILMLGETDGDADELLDADEQTLTVGLVDVDALRDGECVDVDDTETENEIDGEDDGDALPDTVFCVVGETEFDGVVDHAADSLKSDDDDADTDGEREVVGETVGDTDNEAHAELVDDNEGVTVTVGDVENVAECDGDMVTNGVADGDRDADAQPLDVMVMVSDVERVCVTDVVNETDTVGVEVYDVECVEQPDAETEYVGDTLLLAETVRVAAIVPDTLEDLVINGDAERDPEWDPVGERLAELEKDAVADGQPLTVCDRVGDPDTEGDAVLLLVMLDDDDTQRVAVEESDAVDEREMVGDTECDVVSVGELESVGDKELLTHTVGDRESVGLAVIDDDSVDVTDGVDETDGLGLIVVDTRGVVVTSGDFDGVVDTDGLALADVEREYVELADGDVERDDVTEREMVTDGLVVTVLDPTGDDEMGADRETVKEMDGDALTEMVADTVGLALKHEEPENEAVIDALSDGEPESVFVMLTLVVCDADVDIVRVTLGDGDSVPVLDIRGEKEFVTLVVYVDEAERQAVDEVVDDDDRLGDVDTDAQMVDVPDKLLEPELE